MNSRELINLAARYFFIIFIGLFGINAIYLFFTPLTIYPSFWILALFYPLSLEGNSFVFGSAIINIIPACIAGAAYYLLFILNFATPIPPKQRLASLLFLISSFLALNIIRLVVFTSLFLNGFAYFDLAHKFVWYAGSTILVVAIWFANVRLFNIKAIPAWTDLKNLNNMRKRGIKR